MNIRLVARLARHETLSFLRTPVAAFFTVEMPLLMTVIVGAAAGNETVDLASGVRVVQFVVPVMTVFGIVRGCFGALAIHLADLCDRGWLKRVHGTPVPAWALMAGLAGASLAIASATVSFDCACGRAGRAGSPPRPGHRAAPEGPWSLSTYGTFGLPVTSSASCIDVGGRSIPVTAHRDPAGIDWAAYDPARMVGQVLPELAGRLDGIALRVPVEDGSLTDLAALLARPATAEEINQAFAEAAGGGLEGVLRYSTAPLVSRDIIGDPASCVFDSALTQAGGELVKIFGWYDNEGGYASRLVEMAARMAAER